MVVVAPGGARESLAPFSNSGLNNANLHDSFQKRKKKGSFTMLKYWLSRHGSRGEVLSIDKLIIKGEVSFDYSNFFELKFAKFISESYKAFKFVKDNCRISDNFAQYHFNYNFKLINNSAFFFAYQHNSHNKDKKCWKIEFNPNKCFPDLFLDEFISFVVNVSKDIQIAQMDLAIDFPMPRTNFYFDKDKRKSVEKVYETVNDGFGNTTEYLSVHNSHGFCKLYNKSVESDLDFACTRFEITLQDYSKSKVIEAFPDLHIYDKTQLTFDELQKIQKLSQNDCVLLEMACKYPQLYQKLTYRKRMKLAPYVKAFAPIYEINYDVFFSLYSEMIERLNFKWMI